MIVKLTNIHEENVKQLFYQSNNHMGIDVESFNREDDFIFRELAYEVFCSNYLTGLENYHAYGYINQETGNVDSLISFYQGDDDPSWYFTLCRSVGNNFLLKDIFDEVIKINEKEDRLKFYTLVNIKHARLLRKFIYSKYNAERYGYFDEGIIPANTKPYFMLHWELLTNRILIPVDTVVRCSYLKQEYRTELPILGAI